MSLACVQVGRRVRRVRYEHQPRKVDNSWVTRPPRCTARRSSPARRTPCPQPTPPWWRQPSVTIPIAISMIAVLFTAATYWDQHQADQEAAAVATRSDASLVSFWEGTQNPTVVYLQNRSAFPVQSIMIQFAFSPGASSRISYANIPIDGVLPPCTEAEFKTVLWPPLDEDPINLPLSLFFTSANGQVWQISDFGYLQESTYPNDVTVRATYALADMQTVGGCG